MGEDQYGELLPDDSWKLNGDFLNKLDNVDQIHPEGIKNDSDKLRWDLLPYDAVEKIVEVMTYGAKKYAPNNWQKVKMERYDSAQMRHKVARLKGEKYDKESGLLHIAHEACNVLFELWKIINGVE